MVSVPARICGRAEGLNTLLQSYSWESWLAEQDASLPHQNTLMARQGVQ
ncbi:hypothetical protein [Yersinia hibernica]|nr:hypothetical protein [Yersinia hibernica]